MTTNEMNIQNEDIKDESIYSKEYFEGIKNKLLQIMIDNNVSDLFITVNSYPVIRLYGELVALKEEGLKLMDANYTKGLAYALFDGQQSKIKKFEEEKEVDFAISFRDNRYRVNTFHQMGACAVAVRYLPSKMYGIDDLNLPEVYREVTKRASGIILVAGPTGSGKTTTLTAMIDEINSNFSKHIITIEDPIEYVHQHKKSLIEQREVGEDTESFAKALKSALRQNPDVVLVGEMRDLDSIQNALTLSETGHLVLATIHARSSAQCITKIIDSFPGEQQNQVRLQLSESIVGIFSQRLIRSTGGNAYVLATETMVANSAIRNLIRENKIYQINTTIQMSKKEGMHTLEDDILKIIKDGRISFEEGLKCANDPQYILKNVT